MTVVLETGTAQEQLSDVFGEAEANRTLAERREQDLKHALDVKNRFLATVSHDLRAPIKIHEAVDALRLSADNKNITIDVQTVPLPALCGDAVRLNRWSGISSATRSNSQRWAAPSTSALFSSYFQ